MQLGRRQGFDGERMDGRFQQLIEGRVHQTVAGKRGKTAKRFGDDAHAEVALPARRPGVARVQVALVHDDQLRGRKSGLEEFAQTLGARLLHG